MSNSHTFELGEERTQRERDALMRLLPVLLKFQDVVAVLDWLCAFQSCAGHISGEDEALMVAETLVAAGYKPGANTGADFDETSGDNVAHYIVGNVIRCLRSQRHEIHRATQSVIEQWRREFPELWHTGVAAAALVAA
jgi:hypothetical protein